jgi:hypothetical protein
MITKSELDARKAQVAEAISDSTHAVGVINTGESIQAYNVGGGNPPQVIMAVLALQDLCNGMVQCLAQQISEEDLQELFTKVKQSRVEEVTEDKSEIVREMPQ